MSIHKITPFLSDIKDFFKNSDMTAAMQNISSVLAQVKMTERDTLAVTSKRNCVYRLLTVFQCLLLFPCFGIKNVYRNQKYGTLDPLIKARKDVFYRFMENPSVDWRKALWHVSVQLWNRIHLRSDHKADEVCLILDDTDHEKTGRTIERIGRVHSHTCPPWPPYKCQSSLSVVLLLFDHCSTKIESLQERTSQSRSARLIQMRRILFCRPV